MPDGMDDMTTKPRAEKIIALKIMWAKAKPTECNNALAKDLIKALTDAGYRIVDQGLTPLEEHLLAMLASEYDQQRDGGFDRDVEQLFLNEGLSLNAYRAMTTDTGS